MAGNSPEKNAVAGASGDLSSFFAICDADDEILSVEEEMVEKVMHELLKEINGPVPGSGSTAGFVVGESCGPAFSCSGSTVMAGIEMSGGGGTLVAPIKGVFSGLGAVGLPAEDGGGGGNGRRVEEGKGKEKQCGIISMQGGGKEMRMDGYDGEDSNDEDEDEWLTMVLNYAPPELDDWL